MLACTQLECLVGESPLIAKRRKEVCEMSEVNGMQTSFLLLVDSALSELSAKQSKCSL